MTIIGDAITCCSCKESIQPADDATRVSRDEMAHTACAFAVNDALFFFLDSLESELEQ